MNNRKGGVAEPLMTRRRQQTVPERVAGTPVAACGEGVEATAVGGAQDTPGVGGRTRDESSARNRRDPPRQPTSGKGGAHKPKAKGRRAGRESEGPIVPARAATKTPPEGRGPALVMSADGGKCEGMAERPNNPIDKARQLQRRLYVLAKRGPQGRIHANPNRIGWGDGLPEAWHRSLHRTRARDTSRPSVSRVRENRMHGLKGGFRNPGPQGHRA